MLMQQEHYEQQELSELPLESSTAFLGGGGQHSFLHLGSQKHLLAGEGWPGQGAGGDGRASPAIRAYTPSSSQQQEIFETVSQLSLSDSPVKRPLSSHVALLHPTGLAPSQQQPPPPGLAPPFTTAGLPLPTALPPPTALPLPVAAPSQASFQAVLQTQELQRTNTELRRRVQELQDKLSIAERTPTPAYNTEPEIRELQGKLQSKQREALAAQDALERARAEAKNVAAQLEAERSKSAGLLDEVAQWRDEYTKMKKECAALHKKLESITAQGSLADSALAGLKRQNADLEKTLEEQEGATRDLHSQLHSLQAREGGRQRQMQQLVDQVEGLQSENMALRQQLMAASAEEGSRHSQLQQLWDERERMHSENASLRQQVQELSVELQHLGDAFMAAKSQLRERASRDSAAAADWLAAQHHASGQAAGYAGALGRLPMPQQGYAGGYAAEERPGTAPAQQQMWQLGVTQGRAGAAAAGGGGGGGGAYYGGGGVMEHQQQGWAAPGRPHSAQGQSGPAAAAGPSSAVLRSLCFDRQQQQPQQAQQLEGPAAWGSNGQQRGEEPADGRSPLGPAGCNPNPNPKPRSSQPQPYSTDALHRPSSSPGYQQQQEPPLPPPQQQQQGLGGGGGPASLRSSQQGLRLRQSCDDDGSALSAELSSAMKAQRVAAIPFGNEDTLQDMLARTQAMEERLMRLGMEKNDLESEYARIPTSTAQGRRRKEEVSQRLEIISKESSNIRLQLKKLGYK